MTKSRSDPYKYFRIEAAELIDKLTRGLLHLEKKGFKPETIDALNRAAHSMKGAARLVELFAIGDVAHVMEGKLAEIRKAKKTSKGDIDKLLRQVDEIDTLCREALSGGSSASKPKATQPTPERDHPAADAPDAAATAAAPAGALEPVAPEPEPPEERPSRSRPEKRRRGNERIAWVSTQVLERIGHCAGLVVELGRRATDWSKQLEELRDSLRVLTARLDSMQDAEDLQVDASFLCGSADSAFEEISRGLSGIGSLGQRLYTLTLEARVVCIDEVSHRFEKTVRDAALELGRLVELKISGREVLVDRFALQRLMEPIGHLLRNAVVHGIESPADRRKAGKAQEGTVKIKFSKIADHVRIIVEDDGRGLDAELIRKAASVTESRGGSGADESDITGLIFRPGLSTQARPSKIAGRGVGLDVVRAAVDELGGTISVKSEPGRFCRFSIEIPSNLDVMDVFVVTVGDQDLLIPMSRMVGTRIVGKQDIVNIAGKDVVLVGAFPVPVLSLAGLLEIPFGLEEGTTNYRVAIVRSGQQKFALAADDLRGKQRAAIKSVSPELASSRILAGHATLADGRTGFLLHVDALSELARGGSFAIRRPSQPRPATRRSVLVVDDSLTSRMNEKAILETGGYCVHVAKDGEEALSLLPHVRCEMVILDYEMPGMNGIQLAQKIRSIPEYTEVPMLMLSSVDDGKVKADALATGLKAYLVKGEFDQARFLDTVRESMGELEKHQ